MKITLTDLSNLQNETTAVNAINANNALIETAFDNTLSRDGSVPNTMAANLDMNNNQILNLPAPASADSPARLRDVVDSATIASVPPVGTSGAVVGLLNADKTDSGNNTFSGTNTINLAANSVTNAMLAQAGANTVRGNITGSTANVTDVSKASLISWIDPVTSIAGNTGAFTLTGGVTNSANQIKLSLTNGTFQSSLMSPTGTANVSGVMMGVGGTCKLTPTYSTRILITFTGYVSSTNAGVTPLIIIRYGTGTAPTNGATPSGTVLSQNGFHTNTAGYVIPWSLTSIATGLSAGTQYWFDLSLTSGGAGTATMNSVFCTLVEI